MSAERKFILRPHAGGEGVELKDTFLVGRKDDCDLVIKEGHPSRNHARFSIDGEGVTVTDLESANGTFVNGSRIKGGQRLKNGDELAFDTARYKFVIEGEPADDGGATVIRSVADLERTILRPAADLQKELEAAAKAVARESPREAAKEASKEAPKEAPREARKETPREPAKETPRADAPREGKKDAPVAGGAVKPGSWADPDSKSSGAGTQVFSREDLQKLAGEYNAVGDSGNDPYLQIGTGKSAGKVITLRVGQGASEWTIGKDSARDIVFADEGVSDFHAKIIHQAGRWKIVDQLSTNGTYINNAKVVTGFLNAGDRLKIGSVECVLQFPGQERGGSSGGGGKTGLIIGAVVFVLLLGLAYLMLM
jgi:pSer/pThr/pTyr-binding forkhead associated (FHA) protein